MIDYIRGRVAELNPTYVVIEAAGVGYEVNIALTSYSALIPLADKQEEAKVFTTEIIREDTHDLYGFMTKGEREVFIQLVSVSGIGANTARMIMSAYNAGELRQIIATGNAKALGQVKGLGPKTAQRIIVDLKDKILKIELDGERAGMAVPVGEMFPADTNPVKDEAVQALVMLGFSAAACNKVTDKILKEQRDATVEQVIKTALKML